MTHSAGSDPFLAQSIEAAVPHDHLCLIYETAQEQLAAAITFIRIGLERGEQCIYIVDENAADTVLDAMQGAGVDVDRAMQRGALMISDRRTYLGKGYFDPDEMIAFLGEAARGAERAGFAALRVTGEMTWALGGDPGAERLIEYEAKLNQFFQTNNVVGICQYNRSRFEPEVIRDVIRTHPKVISGGLVCRNHYYIPPEEFLSKEGTSLQVERLLKNIIARERNEIALREGKAALEQKNLQLQREIAERQRTGEQLQIYRRIIASANDAIGIIDPSGFYLEQNDAHRRLIGYSDEELRGKTPTIHLGEEAFGRVAEQLARTGSYRGVHVSTTRSGEKIDVELAAFAMRNEGGEIVCHVGIKRDITERKRAEAALRRANDQLSAKMEQLQRQLSISHVLHQISSRFALGEKSDQFLIEVVKRITELTRATRCGIALIDSDQKRVRPRAFFGFDQEVMERLKIPLVQNENDPFHRLLHRGETLTLHPIWSDPGMERYRPHIERLGVRSFLCVPLQVRGVPLGFLCICDKEGELPFLLEDTQLIQTIANQIAMALANQEYAAHLERINEELQRRKIQAEEASRLKSQFLSNVSHELRTPLNAIIGYTHLLIEEVYGEIKDGQRMALGGVRRNARDLSRLVNDVLDLAKIEAGKMAVAQIKVEIAPLIEEVVAGIDPLPAEKGLPVRCFIDPDLPPIESDPGKIKQILVNLLSNAVKFTAKGEITVRARKPAGRTGIEVAVEDTGIGIKNEALPRIFDTFHQLDGEATREFGGVGLGLAIVKELLALLEGEIRVESEYGRGSIFTFLLPAEIGRKEAA